MYFNLGSTKTASGIQLIPKLLRMNPGFAACTSIDEVGQKALLDFCIDSRWI